MTVYIVTESKWEETEIVSVHTSLRSAMTKYPAHQGLTWRLTQDDKGRLGAYLHGTTPGYQFQIDPYEVEP